MTSFAIKKAVDDGYCVYWKTPSYRVEKWEDGTYNIVCQMNGHPIGLTWLDGKTLNGKPEDFYLGDKK